MKNIKMIVTDLDKTLLRNDKTISEYTKTILTKCCERGFLLVFATARPERATRQWQINHTSCYTIANNGATIFCGAKQIQTTPIPEATKHSIIQRVIADKNITGLCAETGEVLYSNDNSYSTWGEAYPQDSGWNPVFHNFLTPVVESICKLSVECADAEIVSGILRNYPDLRVFPNSGELWYQITHASVSKYNAIAYLSKQTGITPVNIIAFGDDFNDVEMLEKCGIGVAVANAVAPVKEAADFVCDTNDNDGVAKYLSDYLLSAAE